MLNSIGLIESKGLVALIEAADVILKNSPVKILGIKKLENGLVSLAVFGNSDYVKAAIESAVEAGRRVGEIYASTVVDDPGKELMTFFSDLFSFNNTLEVTSKKTKTENVSQIVHEIKNDPDTFVPIIKMDKSESKREKSKPLSVTKISSIRNIKKAKEKPASESMVKSDQSIPEKSEDVKNESGQNDESAVQKKPLSTIERLRIEALGLESKKIRANENTVPVKKKNNESKPINLSSEIIEVDFDAITKMNVHKLRHYAREFPEFPIRGRAISRANRDELIELFKSISNK
ncbi:MAG: BMC domain-containing protein [Ignavibacteria bacterium]|nr:BMC domain-containing protein [Ignavibacteria bacterium]